MVAANGKEVAVAAKDEHVKIGPRERDAAGKGQRAPVDVVRAISLHEIREAAGTADAGNGGELLLPELALLDHLKVKREHGEIATTRAPGGVVGGDFLLGQRLAVNGGWKDGDIVGGVTHGGIHIVKALRR